MTTKKSIISALVLTLLIFLACNSAPETYTVETKDGVRHVHNLAPLWGDEPKIELEFVQKIGELEGNDENYQLYRPSDMALDSENNIYIVDSGNYRIMKYNENGKLLISFGNKGQGPGEFEIPYRIFLKSDDEICIMETGGAATVNVFNSRGELLREFNRDRTNVLFKGFSSEGHYAFYSRSIGDTFLLHLYKEDSTAYGSFGKRRMYEEQRMRKWGNRYDCIFDPEDFLYFAFSQQNRLEKYSIDGKLIWKSSRVLPYEESLEHYWVNPDAITVNHFSNCIQRDSENRIWVTTYSHQDVENRKNPGSRVFEVFDNDGILLTKIENDRIFSISRFKIYGDRLFIVDPLHEHAVFEYRIIQK